MNFAPLPPRGAVRRRPVIVAGAAGLLVIVVFIAGNPGSPAAAPHPHPAPQAAKLAGLGRTTKLASTGAAARGTRLLGEAATAARAVPYRAVQVISWLAGSGAGWLSSGPDRVRMRISHRTGQLPDAGLGLSHALVGLLDAHYVVIYTGQGSAAGRAASVVEVRHRDGSVAARFWLDDATKLPLRREIFGSQAQLVGVDDLDGLTLPSRPAKPTPRNTTTTTSGGGRGPAGTSGGTAGTSGGTAGTSGGTAGTRPSTDRAAPAAEAASGRPPATATPRPAAVSRAASRMSDAMSVVGFGGASLALVSPTASATAAPAAGPAAGASVPKTGSATAGPATAASAAPAGPASRAPATAQRPWADRLGQTQLSALRAGGWPVPAVMPDGLTLFGASERGTSSGRVLDLAYSDGLSVISLFLQRGQLPAALPGWRQADLGGHQVYLRNPAEPDVSWSAGGYVYTVVAGAPAAVIASVVRSLPHQGRLGFWSRMDRGARRVFSWINPFH